MINKRKQKMTRKKKWSKVQMMDSTDIGGILQEAWKKQ